MQNEVKGRFGLLSVLVAVALLTLTLPMQMSAQDDDDPPGRAARLGQMDGSVSFQPAGESEWVEAMPNRPMTTGDKLWADRESRAEVELGSTSIHLSSNTGISFLNLDDRTVQIQLSTGTISVRVRRLNDDDVVEIDTPNQAFSVFQPGRYRVESSDDGTYTVVTVREGEGESTGNGQTYTVHEGQRATFSGSDRLSADVQQIEEQDEFDRWSYRRDRRFDESRSSRYVSRDVVGAEDLDEYGDWRPSPEYGNVWYPRVDAGWAPYHTGHWAWIDPWGWTWVDDAPWGYAPFHYGRWAFVEGRWGWVPGPVEVRPVYAPALVVFVGGGGPAMGGNVAWFPLGPREVYVPSYHVSPAYVNRVNISNTTVNQTTVTNVYNTTIVNNTTVVNNVTYANRTVSGAVTAVPQQAFAGGQSVARAAVVVSRQQIAAAPVGARVAVAPAPTAVLGVRANVAVHVVAPPAAVLSRPVIAKTAPPPAPVSFAAKQQVLAAHPGQPVARQEMQRIRPASVPAGQPLVRQAPPAQPATTNVGRPGNQPGNPAVANRPEPNQPNRPSEPNRGFQPPARNDRPMAAQPNNRPEMNPPVANRPEPNSPNRTSETNPTNRPSEPNRPTEPPARNDRPAPQPTAYRPSAPNSPTQNARPTEPARPPEAPARPQNQTPNEAPQQRTPPPAAARPAQPQPPQHPQPASQPQKQDDKKHQDANKQDANK